MYKILIIISLLSISFSSHAQEKYTFQLADSLTYNLYLAGNWDELIKIGNEVLNQDFDFKYLRQRMGYAYFVKGDYYASQNQYEKALPFDKNDVNTQTYLYYCSFYLGNESAARYQISQFPDSLRKSFGVSSLKLIDAIDGEYNYKTSYEKRSAPNYYRVGLNSKLGYRLNLYQSFSSYSQTTDNSIVKQNEYVGILNWSINSHTNLTVGFHSLNSNVVTNTSYIKNDTSYIFNAMQHRNIMVISRDTIPIKTTTDYPGNLIYSKLSYSLSRFDFALNASILNHNNMYTKQFGLHAGVVLPGKSTIYLKSSLYNLTDDYDTKLIFSQSIGGFVVKKLWANGSITFGNLKNFTDNNGLYIYNSIDPTVFRTGLSLFWYIVPKITLFSNYTFDTKQIDNNNTTYKQHSISGGLIWKL